MSSDASQMREVGIAGDYRMERDLQDYSVNPENPEISCNINLSISDYQLDQMPEAVDRRADNDDQQ